MRGCRECWIGCELSATKQDLSLAIRLFTWASPRRSCACWKSCRLPHDDRSRRPLSDRSGKWPACNPSPCSLFFFQKKKTVTRIIPNPSLPSPPNLLYSVRISVGVFKKGATNLVFFLRQLDSLVNQLRFKEFYEIRDVVMTRKR